MELCQGNLSELLEQNSSLDFNAKLKIMVQVANGVKFIHEKRIIHKDLKPDNILIKDFASLENAVKITDFGLARALEDDERTESASLSFGGSRPYIAPELLKVALGMADKNTLTNDNLYAVDVWSFGVIVYKVFLGTNDLFKDTSLVINFDAENHVKRDFEGFDNAEFMALLLEIFKLQPIERPKMKTVHEKLREIN